MAKQIVVSDVEASVFNSFLLEGGHIKEPMHIKANALFTVSLNESDKPFNGGGRKRVLGVEDVECIKKLAADGVSNAKVARKYGCSESTVRFCLKGDEYRECHNQKQKQREREKRKSLKVKKSH